MTVNAMKKGIGGVRISEFEFDTLCGYAEGLDTFEVAERLGQSRAAVYNHRKALFNALRVSEVQPMYRMYHAILEAWRRGVLRTCPVCRRKRTETSGLRGAGDARHSEPLLRPRVVVPIHLRLTDRRMEILRLAARGQDNIMIAKDLHLTVNTVKAQIRSIFKQWGARDRTHMVALGFSYGLLTAADVLPKENSGDLHGEPGPDGAGDAPRH